MKFRKKPIIIEAIQWVGHNDTEIIDFVGIDNFDFNKPFLTINTKEGHMRVSLNDWIIKGIKGEFYPCKPDIFKQTYEKVIEDDEN